MDYFKRKIKMFNTLFFKTLPVKGDVIDTSDGEMLVLKMEGNIATLIARRYYKTGVKFNDTWDSSKNTTFGSEEGCKYEGSDLDTYISTTVYNNMSSDIKNAIVDTDIYQDMYSYSSTRVSGKCYNHYITSSDQFYLDGNHSSIGPITRKVFAPSIDDIIEYLNVSPSDTIGVTPAGLLNMLYQGNSGTGNLDIWLRTARPKTTGQSHNIWTVNGIGAGNERPALSSNSSSTNGTVDLVKYMFRVDLTRMNWNISTT